MVTHFVNNAATHVNQIVPKVTDGAMSALKSYHWPGNIRQLENTIFRLVALNNNLEITATDVSAILYDQEGSETVKNFIKKNLKIGQALKLLLRNNYLESFTHFIRQRVSLHKGLMFHTIKLQ